MEDRLLYRVTEVAVFLNVSRSKVYELLGSGDLPSVKIDRTRLIRGSHTLDPRLGPTRIRKVPSAVCLAATTLLPTTFAFDTWRESSLILLRYA